VLCNRLKVFTCILPSKLLYSLRNISMIENSFFRYFYKTKDVKFLITVSPVNNGFRQLQKNDHLNIAVDQNKWNEWSRSIKIYCLRLLIWTCSIIASYLLTVTELRFTQLFKFKAILWIQHYNSKHISE